MASSTYPVLVKSDEERYQEIDQLLGSDTRVPKTPGKQTTIPWLPLVGYGMNALTTIGSMMYNSWQQDKQNQYQEQLIDKQNQYNSPSAQLARLLHAGVPYNTAMQALVGSAVGNQTQPMAGQAAPYTPVSPPSLQDSMALQATQDQHDISQSQVRLNDAQAYSLDPNNPLNQAKRSVDEATSVLLNSQNEHELLKMGYTRQEIANLQQNMKLLKYQTKEAFWKAVHQAKETKNYDRYLNTMVQSLSSKSGLDVATTFSILSKLASEINLLDSQASNQNAAARKQNFEADILGATDSSGKLLSVLIKEFEVQRAKNDAASSDLDLTRKRFDLLPLLRGANWTDTQYSDWLAAAYFLNLATGLYKDPISVGDLHGNVLKARALSAMGFD